MSESAGLQSTISTLQVQNAALRQLVVIHDRLGTLVLQGADVTAITRMMADLVGRRILLLDALLQVVAMAVPSGDQRFSVDGFVWAPGHEYVRAVRATLARERRQLRAGAGGRGRRHPGVPGDPGGRRRVCWRGSRPADCPARRHRVRTVDD